MKTTIALIALAITSASAGFCPFPVSIANSPCSASSACHTSGLLHADCQSQIESFCCAGSSFDNYPEVNSICAGLASCDSTTVSFKSARSSRNLGASGADGDNACSAIGIYGDMFAKLPNVAEVITDPTDEDVIDMNCSGETPNTVWTAIIDPVPFAVSSTLKLSIDDSTTDIIDCEGAGCAVACTALMNKVTVTYTEGGSAPTITCEASATALEVFFVSDVDSDDLDFTTGAAFDSLGDGVYDYLLEDPGVLDVSFKIGFGLGATQSFGAVGCGDAKDEECAIVLEEGGSALITYDANTETVTIEVLADGDSITTAVSLPFVTTDANTAMIGAWSLIVAIVATLMM